jgi:hypothetical protein
MTKKVANKKCKPMMACVLPFKPIAQYMCMQCRCKFAQFRLCCPYLLLVVTCLYAAASGLIVYIVYSFMEKIAFPFLSF